jgi:hypothetical protein
MIFILQINDPKYTPWSDKTNFASDNKADGMNHSSRMRTLKDTEVMEFK